MDAEVTFQDLDDLLSRDDAHKLCELLVAGLDANAVDEDETSSITIRVQRTGASTWIAVN